MSAATARGRRSYPRVALAVLLAGGVLGGCTNPFSPDGDDVGTYKGAPDPLMQESAASRQDALRERFEKIQNR